MPTKKSKQTPVQKIPASRVPHPPRLRIVFQQYDPPTRTYRALKARTIVLALKEPADGIKATEAITALIAERLL